MRRLAAIAFGMAALALALGIGLRIRRVLARPSVRWERTVRRAGGAAIVILPAFGLWQWGQVHGAADRALAMPPVDAPNVLWIVMDTVRADRLSLYGY